MSKVRLALTILHGSRVKDWEALEQETVEHWLTRWSGRATFQRFWLPLLRAKLGESWPEANAAFIWATIQRLYAARRSGLKKEMFGYVPGGYARVLERFATVLEEHGVEIRCSSTGRADRADGCRLAGPGRGRDRRDVRPRRRHERHADRGPAVRGPHRSRAGAAPGHLVPGHRLRVARAARRRSATTTSPT